jgi:hypothetical protein
MKSWIIYITFSVNYTYESCELLRILFDVFMRKVHVNMYTLKNEYSHFKCSSC